MRKSTLWKSGILSLLLFGFAISMAYAQERTVTGTVTSDDQGALPGVNIIVQGTTQGAVTDMDGHYTINVPGPDAVLLFSFIGYSTQAITVGAQTTVDVVLTADVAQLDEIVVTAYATQKKKDLTGSVSVINSDQLTQTAQANVTQAMQGRVAGVTITQDTRPGQAAQIRIRGISSFQSNNPLYIVDGVPVPDINTLNSADIESMSVLKDAGAASIYGAQASNGVIVITTKKGTQGMKVNYNMYMGTQTTGSGPDNLANTQEYADLQWLVYANTDPADVEASHPVYGDTDNANPTLPSWAADTDWYDEVFNNAFVQNHDLSLSGGNDNAKFFASMNYLDQDGVVLYNWFKRYSGRFNSEFKIKDRLTIGENISVTHRSDNGVSGNGVEGTAVAMGVYRSQPIIPVVWENGTFAGLGRTFEDGDWGGTALASRLGNGTNYVADRTRDKDDVWQDLRVQGNVYADLKIIEGLNVRSTFGGSINNWYQTNWTSDTYERAENVGTPTYQEQGGIGGTWTWTNTLTYNKQFGGHSLLLVAGYEAGKYGMGRAVGATGAGYFSSAFAYRTVSTASALQSGYSSFYTPRSIVSQFARADYNLNSKYYLSATVRRDGSSVFGAESRYGVFPSATAAWRISEESFLAGLTWLNDMKIRGGYGTMGNQLAVDAANQYYLYGGAPNSSFYDLGGTMNSSVQGFRPTRIGNPNAKWETAKTANVGFDAVLFDRTIEVNLEWYTKENIDLLYNPELPATAGAASQPYVNVGHMRNSGIDLQLIYHKIWGDFSFEANGTFTTYNNEIVAIAEGIDYWDAGGSRIGGFNRNEVGHSMGEFFGYEVEGLYQESDLVWDAVADKYVPSSDAVAVQDGQEPGFFKYVDQNGDGEITDDDRTYIGSPHPDFTYGLNLTFGYKGFDLTAFFYGSQGQEAFNYNKWWLDFWPSFQGQKSTDLLYNSWTPTNTDATVPKASNKSNFSTNQVSNSYYIEDASYLRLKNLQLGYTFDRSVLGNVFSSARIYVQGTNLLTFTKYSGLNPELLALNDDQVTTNDDHPGVDEGNLPVMKQFLVGISLGF
ncbi:MAG: TonB-dependent receptor [Bacteroidales bacterium]